MNPKISGNVETYESLTMKYQLLLMNYWLLIIS